MELLRISIFPEAVEEVTGDITVRTIRFGGQCESPLFRSSIVGRGADTQRMDGAGNGKVSARYLLEGRDADGTPCRLFIENNGRMRRGIVKHTKPRIVTDSPRLAGALRGRLRGALVPGENGFFVVISNRKS